MKNIKYISWVVAMLILVVLAYLYFVVLPSSGNADYICVKSVDSTCDITQVWEWKDWRRESYWEKVTEVAYYNIRTACETWYETGTGMTWDTRWHSYSGYTSATEHLTDKGISLSGYLDYDWVNIGGKDGGGWSWRASRDFTYSSTNCSITEYDYVEPEWKVEQLYEEQ